MTQSMIMDKTNKQNITFGLTGKGILDNNNKFRNMCSQTVIIITDEFEDEGIIRDLADTILTRGCKNVAFCGTASDEWQRIFCEEDREINGFCDAGNYDDFAIMWRFEDLESLSDVVGRCWNEVLILCSNLTLIRECRTILTES